MSAINRSIKQLSLALLVLAAFYLFHYYRQLTQSPPATTPCKLLHVYDGDTIKARCEGQTRRLRLYCIDAPEYDQKPWGEKSTAYLRSQLPEYFEIQVVGKDQYQRTLAKIFVGGEDVNGSLLQSGWAVVYQRFCPRSEQPGYYNAEQLARRNKLGVWRKEGKQQRPWEWRR